MRAGDVSVAAGAVIRVAIDGYDFWQQRSDGWLPLAPDGSNRPRSFGEVLDVSLWMDGYRVELEDVPDQPQIVCQPLGELTPFELTLQSEAVRWQLVGRANGELEAQSADDMIVADRRETRALPCWKF